MACLLLLLCPPVDPLPLCKMTLARQAPHRTGSFPPLRSEEVPADLVCSICFGVPLRPTLTPCEHLFCESCADRALESGPACPNCRGDCEQDQLRALTQGSLLYRVWSSVGVKCPKHDQGCAWTGSIVDAIAHIQSCQHCNSGDADSNSIAASREEVDQLERKITQLEGRLAQKDRAIRTLRDDFAQTDSAIRILQRDLTQKENTLRALRNDVAQKDSRIQALQNTVAQKDSALQSKKGELRTLRDDCRLELPILFNGEYHYKRENVVQLSQLISRYFDSKPPHIDSNRIYNCIRSCYNDL